MRQSLLSKTSTKTVYAFKMLSSASCFACLFAFASFASDHKETTLPGRNVVDYTPVQGYLQPLKLRRETLFEYTCNECHRVFDTVDDKKTRIAEHVDLKLNHGKDVGCLSCHHKTNRNAYVTNDGREIPSNRPEELCSRCHNMTYRDWTIGAHGRTTGVWNRAGTGWRALVCTECHNPHSPQFPYLAPMSGPGIPKRPFRMGAH